MGVENVTPEWFTQVVHYDSHSGLSLTNPCIYVYKYFDQIKKGPVVILAVKKSAGVAPKENWRNPLHTMKHINKEIHPSIGSQARSKGYQWVHKVI